MKKKEKGTTPPVVHAAFGERQEPIPDRVQEAVDFDSLLRPTEKELGAELKYPPGYKRTGAPQVAPSGRGRHSKS